MRIHLAKRQGATNHNIKSQYRLPPWQAIVGIMSLAIILLLTSETAAIAQINGTGAIQGTVSDPTGAVVAGAQVKIVEVATN